MGQCITIETARARRTQLNLGMANVPGRTVRVKTSSGRRVNQTAPGAWWSLSWWLWSVIRQTLGGSRCRMRGPSPAAIPPRKSGPDKYTRI